MKELTRFEHSFIQQCALDVNDKLNKGEKLENIDLDEVIKDRFLRNKKLIKQILREIYIMQSLKDKKVIQGGSL